MHASAGEVVHVGPGVSEYKVGDRVAWTDWSKDVSSYAEYAAVPVISAYKIPDNVSFEHASAVVVTGLTAWTMLRAGCNVQKGGRSNMNIGEVMAVGRTSSPPI